MEQLQLAQPILVFVLGMSSLKGQSLENEKNNITKCRENTKLKGKTKTKTDDQSMQAC
jgi:hypothetical protein